MLSACPVPVRPPQESGSCSVLLGSDAWREDRFQDKLGTCQCGYISFVLRTSSSGSSVALTISVNPRLWWLPFICFTSRFCLEGKNRTNFACECGPFEIEHFPGKHNLFTALPCPAPPHPALLGPYARIYFSRRDRPCITLTAGERCFHAVNIL